MSTPEDCPMVQGDRRVHDKWRETVEQRLNSIDGRLEENAVALQTHAVRHETLVKSVTLNNTQTQRMYEIFVPVENAFIMIGKAYNGAVWLFTKIAKLAKPLMWIFGLGIAIISFFKTGVWDWKP